MQAWKGIPVLQQCIGQVLTEQVFGIGITRLAKLLACGGLSPVLPLTANRLLFGGFSVDWGSENPEEKCHE